MMFSSVTNRFHSILLFLLVLGACRHLSNDKSLPPADDDLDFEEPKLETQRFSHNISLTHALVCLSSPDVSGMRRGQFAVILELDQPNQSGTLWLSGSGPEVKSEDGVTIFKVKKYPETENIWIPTAPESGAYFKSLEIKSLAGENEFSAILGTLEASDVALSCQSSQVVKYCAIDTEKMLFVAARSISGSASATFPIYTYPPLTQPNALFYAEPLSPTTLAEEGEFGMSSVDGSIIGGIDFNAREISLLEREEAIKFKACNSVITAAQ